jgi:hypothetical protein
LTKGLFAIDAAHEGITALAPYFTTPQTDKTNWQQLAQWAVLIGKIDHYLEAVKDFTEVEVSLAMRSDALKRDDKTRQVGERERANTDWRMDAIFATIQDDFEPDSRIPQLWLQYIHNSLDQGTPSIPNAHSLVQDWFRYDPDRRMPLLQDIHPVHTAGICRMAAYEAQSQLYEEGSSLEPRIAAYVLLDWDVASQVQVLVERRELM